MRLFVSLRPPTEVRAHLSDALSGLRTTDPEQWHVTMAFLGEVPDPQPLLPGLAGATSGTGPLHLRLRGTGFFRGPGVLWTGLDGDLASLHALAGLVAVACRDAGVPLEDRPFRPHLTVARRLRRDPGVLTGYAGPAWTAGEVELVRSRLGATAVHEVVARFPLDG